MSSVGNQGYPFPLDQATDMEVPMDVDDFEQTCTDVSLIKALTKTVIWKFTIMVSDISNRRDILVNHCVNMNAFG